MAAAVEGAVLRALPDVLPDRGRRPARARPDALAGHRSLSRYLLDTNIVSLLGPTLRDDTDARLIAWLDERTDLLFMPVISLAELTAGVAKLRRAGSLRRAAAFEAWIGDLAEIYRARILLLDVAAALETGRLSDRASAIGRSPGFADLAIAGIALAHGLTILTRDLRHFAPLGVRALDPYVALPE